MSLDCCCEQYRLEAYSLAAQAPQSFTATCIGTSAHVLNTEHTGQPYPNVCMVAVAMLYLLRS